MSKQPGAEEFAREIFRVRALSFGDFTLSSGRRSGFYLDLRLIPSHPEVYTIGLDAYRGMAERIGLDEFDAVAGLATAGIAFSAPLAATLRKPMVYVRSESKSHGLKRFVEGDLRPGSRVVLVDDVATTGGSLASAALSIRTGGHVVAHAIVLVDRLEGAMQRLSEVGVELASFTDVKEIASQLRKAGLIGGPQAGSMSQLEVRGVGRS